VVLNLIEFGLAPRAAVDASRTHHQWFPDRLMLEGRNWPEATRTSLSAIGHHLGVLDHQGIANTIVVDQAHGRLYGLGDHRRATSTASGD
jgi:gamma-glutamyltranspeptidase/glutathione hydrolase